MTEQPPLRILSFHKQYLQEPKPVSGSSSAEYAISFILYTPSEQLQLTEQFLRQSLNTRQDCCSAKCHSISGLNQALTSHSKSLKTIIILDEIQDEVIKTSVKHHHLMQREHTQMCIALLVDSVEAVNYQLFHQVNVNVITSDERKIAEFIDDMLKNTDVHSSTISKSSLTSADLEMANNVHNYLDSCAVKEPERQEGVHEKEGEILVASDTPGPGTYNIKNSSNSISFSIKGKNTLYYLQTFERVPGPGAYAEISPNHKDQSFKFSRSNRFPN